jgi:hypothetical protein
VPDEMLMDDEFAPGRVVVASILAAANALSSSSGNSSSAGRLLRIASTILSFGFIENSVCAELASGAFSLCFNDFRCGHVNNVLTSCHQECPWPSPPMLPLLLRLS